MGVMIKNIPLDFLRSKGDSFFDSEEFQKAVELFNKYKKPIKDDEPITNSVIPLDYLKDLLYRKYNELDIVLDTRTDVENAIFIGLSGKYIDNNKLDFKLRRRITRTSNSVHSVSHFYSTYIDNNFYYYRSKDLSKPTTNLRDRLSNKTIRPAPTTNAVKDITKLSNFYESILNTVVYDRKKYTEMLLSNDRMRPVPSTYSVKLFAPSLYYREKFYRYNKDEIQRSIDNLKRSLTSKYYDEYTVMHNGSILKNPTDINQNLLVSLLRNHSKDYPINILYLELLNTNSVLVNLHRMQPAHIVVYNNTTKTLEPLFRVNHTINNVENDGYYTITFPSNMHGYVLVLYDRYNKNSLAERVLYKLYSSYLNESRIDKYRVSVVNGNSEIHLRNYHIRGAFIETYDENNLLNTRANIKIEKDKVSLSNLPGNYATVYVLPTYKVLSNIDTLKVSTQNIESFLEKYNPLSKEIKVWYAP